MAATPSFANAVIRVLRILLGRAVKLGWIPRNPAEKPGLQGTDPSGLIWPREAVAAFVAAADRMGRHSIGTAVMLDEWLGQRQGDILKLPRSVYRAGVLSIRQSKTGAGVSLPIDLVPQLAQRLAEEMARVDARFAGQPVKPAQLIVDEATGHAYAADRFRHLFADVRAEAAKTHPSFQVDYLLPGRTMDDPDAFRIKMTDLWFMHLRHTAVTRLAEAECEIPLISAVTGHSPKSVQEILSRYLVRTRKLAKLAFQRRLAAEGNGYAADRQQDKAE
jgi:integrase